MNHRIRKAAASVLVSASLALGAVVGSAVPAAAADSSYWLTNSDSNSGSFDCYVYLGGRWQKINDGHTKKGLSRTTVFKCDHDWYAMSVTGSTVTGTLKANHNYQWTSSALARIGSFRWAVALQR